MIIEKSPFYKSNVLVNTDNKKQLGNDPSMSDNVIEEKKSFWSWFKGLVNPLQNLPLISGIYSSVNSEDESSDRDMVQNSLGGFLYGGPIGAIAGFGNWVFEKIFDKTPSEFALDISGISKFWKGDNSNDDGAVNVASSKNNIEKTDNPLFSNLKMKRSGQQYFVKNEDKKSSEKEVANLSESLTKSKIENKKIVINNQKDFSEKESKTTPLVSLVESKPVIDNKNTKLSNNNKISRLNDEKIGYLSDSRKLEPLKDGNEKIIKKSSNYKQINFNYPTWKPEGSQTNFKGVKNLSNRQNLKDFYFEEKSTKDLNLNIDA